MAKDVREKDAKATDFWRRSGRVSIGIGIVLFVLGEILVSGVAVRLHEVPLRNDHASVYLLPFLICLPLLVGYQIYARIKKQLQAAGVNADEISFVWSSLMYLVCLSYVPIVWCLSLLFFALRRIRQ